MPGADVTDMKASLLLVALPLLASCAASTRGPASVDPDSQSVELASRLRGSSLRFRAHRDTSEVSVLGFLELKFKDCEATFDGEYDPSRTPEGLRDSHVDCTAELNSDPVHGDVRVQIVGDKRKFSAQTMLEKSEAYSLTVRVDLAWQDKQWNGSGDVIGWLGQHPSKDSASTLNVRESLRF